MRLGQRLNDIVKRFEIAPPGTPALVPIGGIQTSPMKLTQAYGALENDGILPQVRFLVAVIGTKGNVIGLPPIKEMPRVMSPRTASAVLQDLRGPVKQRHGALGQLCPRSRLRKDGNVLPQRGRVVRRIDA